MTIMRQPQIQAAREMTFDERLAMLAGGRKPYPWLMGLGWTTNTIAKARKGSIPGETNLENLARAENVKLAWLIEGKGGNPFVVHWTTSREALDRQVKEALDEPWEHVFPVSDQGGLRALVVSQPGQAHKRHITIEFTSCKVIGGVFTWWAIDAIKGWSQAHPDRVHPHRVSRQIAGAIACGNVGTWGMLDSPESLLSPEGGNLTIDEIGVPRTLELTKSRRN